MKKERTAQHRVPNLAETPELNKKPEHGSIATNLHKAIIEVQKSRRPNIDKDKKTLKKRITRIRLTQQVKRITEVELTARMARMTQTEKEEKKATIIDAEHKARQSQINAYLSSFRSKIVEKFEQYLGLYMEICSENIKKDIQAVIAQANRLFFDIPLSDINTIIPKAQEEMKNIKKAIVAIERKINKDVLDSIKKETGKLSDDTMAKIQYFLQEKSKCGVAAESALEDNAVINIAEEQSHAFTATSRVNSTTHTMPEGIKIEDHIYDVLKMTKDSSNGKLGTIAEAGHAGVASNGFAWIPNTMVEHARRASGNGKLDTVAKTEHAEVDSHSFVWIPHATAEKAEVDSHSFVWIPHATAENARRASGNGKFAFRPEAKHSTVVSTGVTCTPPVEKGNGDARRSKEQQCCVLM